MASMPVLESLKSLRRGAPLPTKQTHTDQWYIIMQIKFNPKMQPKKKKMVYFSYRHLAQIWRDKKKKKQKNMAQMVESSD